MNIDFTKTETQDLLREGLHSKKMKVSFVKKDGTNRDMLCTLNADFIDANKLPKESKSVSASKDYIRVFDLEANDWRSFRYESIINVEDL